MAPARQRKQVPTCIHVTSLAGPAPCLVALAPFSSDAACSMQGRTPPVLPLQQHREHVVISVSDYRYASTGH